MRTTTQVTLEIHAGYSIPKTFKLETLLRRKAYACRGFNLFLNLHFQSSSPYQPTRLRHRLRWLVHKILSTPQLPFGSSYTIAVRISDFTKM